MQEIKFDFNNMFASAVGPEHGVSEQDLKAMSGPIEAAVIHLDKVLANPVSRVNLGLEWANLPFQDALMIKQIQAAGEEIRAKYENVIFLGIGGSYLGLKAAQDALVPAYANEFRPNKIPKIYFEGNNLDPDTLSELLNNLKPKKTFVIVISKSGETTETKVAFAIVEEWLRKGSGKNYGRQVIAITDPSSGTLRKKVSEEQVRDRQSFRNFPLLKGVGGRYSEFNMGLLHLAVCGIDIREVLDGAKAMAERCRQKDIFKNPAYMYALLNAVLYKGKGKIISILMPFSEGLKSTADWYVQLLAESLGKKYSRTIDVLSDGSEKWLDDEDSVVNVGRTPVSARGTNDLHSIQQNNAQGENNKVITFIKVEKFRSELEVPLGAGLLSGRKFSQLMSLAQEATEWALVRANRPNCAVIMPQVTPFNWGGLLYFFEMATAFEGELLNVNAFDQPGVEGYKNYMYYKLGKPGLSQDIAREIEKHPLVKEQKYIF